MPPIRISNNEGKACDAVVKVLEKRTCETRADIRHPERDLVGPPVDLRLKLGVQEYAIEHTRIEPFENQIKSALVSREISDYIERSLSGRLPGPMYYELHVPPDVCLPEKKDKRNQALRNLADWIQKNAQVMHERNIGRTVPAYSPYHVISPYCWPDDCIKRKPMGFNCAVELLRWPHAVPIRRKPGCIVTRLINPNELEDLRTTRIRRAFSDKFPKLACCKAEGARTVLVMENRDLALTRFDLVGNQLPELLAEHSDQPDEIYLLETWTNLWWVFLMKRDDKHWPSEGMPKWGQPIYHPENLPTAGLPDWYRDAFQLDDLYTPYLPREWIPATFKKDELEDMTLLQ